MSILGGLPSIAIAFTATLVLIQVFRIPARRLGLVDRPDSRKRHLGVVPLVGGVAMFAGFAGALTATPELMQNYYSLVGAMFLLVIVGVKDDIHHLPAPVRFAAQGLAALIIVVGGGVMLHDLGPLLGENTVAMGAWAIPFTVFCVVGVINALNMSDGLDGLAGGVSLTSIIWLIVLVLASGANTGQLIVLMILSAVIVAFLCFNLRHPWRRRASVFMGDCGSMILGLALAWFFIDLSQGEQRAMTPIIAVWLLALPLFDTVSIMIQRLLNGRSPFSPDRHHLHHILIEAGFSEAETAAFLLAASFFCGGIGVFGYFLGVSDDLMLYAFLSLFAIYFFCLLGKRSASLGLERS